MMTAIENAVDRELDFPICRLSADRGEDARG